MIDDALPLHRLVAARLGDVELHSAVDGATGLAIAARLRPTLILLDVDLPDMDGFEVCRRLKAAAGTADIPVIFLTAEGTARQAALDLGAVAYVTKPFRTDDLCARIRDSIETRMAADRAADVDGVTGLWTRPRLDCHLAGLAGPAACVVVDVDGLRLLNARHGPALGDQLLRAVGGVVLEACRAERGVCWAGGGKFGVVLPGSRRDGRRLAGQLAAAIAELRVGGAGVSCGFGVADTHVAGDGTLVGRAAAALADAKRRGMNCVSVARRPRRRCPTENAMRSQEYVSLPPTGPGVVRSSLAGVPAVRRVLPGYVAGLAHDVAVLDGPPTIGRRAEVRRLAHQLRGSGASYGFSDVTRLATAVESAIDADRPAAEVAAAVAALVAVIRRIEGYDPAGERSPVPSVVARPIAA